MNFKTQPREQTGASPRPDSFWLWVLFGGTERGNIELFLKLADVGMKGRFITPIKHRARNSAGVE